MHSDMADQQWYNMLTAESPSTADIAKHYWSAVTSFTSINFLVTVTEIVILNNWDSSSSSDVADLNSTTSAQP